MKLLFDENLSPKLPDLLKEEFPECFHVRDCDLKGESDSVIWDFASQRNYIVVSKDCDFFQRSLIAESAPKVVWLKIGNCSTNQLVAFLKQHQTTIRKFIKSWEIFLILSS